MSLIILISFFFAQTLGVSIQGTGSTVFWSFLETAYQSYKLIDPSFNLNYVGTTNAAVAITTFQNDTSYDFAMIDGSHPTAAQYEGNQIFPWMINTIVPQINLALAKNIILSRSVLARIYMGNITNWNDSAITATNPGLSFPNATIKVFYRKDQQTLNTLWSTALSSFSPEWNATYGISTTFPLPLQNKTNFVGYPSAIALNGAVASVPNSIGYAQLYLVIRDPTLFYAQLIHEYTGKPVPCNGVSVEAAGNGVVFDSNLYAAYSIDNPDPNAWPIATFLAIMIRKTPVDCENARAFFKFMRWTLTAPGSRDAIAQAGCGVLPQNLTDFVLNTIGQLQCDDGTSLYANDNLFNSPLTYGIEDAFFAIAMIMLTLGLALSGVHIYHFSTSKINLSYSIVFVVGTTLTLLSPIFWFLPPQNHGICQLRIWSSSLGLAILLGTMFSRTWQLNDIYTLQKHGQNMDQLRYKTSTNKTLTQLAMTLFGVIFTNFLILVIWSAVDPLSPQWIVTDDVALVGYYTCQSNHTVPWLLLELFFFLFLLCFGIYVIYNTWSFQRQALLVETRYVLLALYNVIVNICAVLPILAFMTVTERVLALVVVVSIDVSGGSIICAVLLPRLIQKLEYSKSGSKGSSEKNVGSARSPTTGTVTSGKRKEKVEISRTPEDELAKRLEEPLPMHTTSNMKGLIIDKEGQVKVEGTREQIELYAMRPTRNFSDIEEETSTSHVTADQSPRIDSSRATTSPTSSPPPRRSFRRNDGVGSFDSETGLLQSLEESSGGHAL